MGFLGWVGEVVVMDGLRGWAGRLRAFETVPVLRAQACAGSRLYQSANRVGPWDHCRILLLITPRNSSHLNGFGKPVCGPTPDGDMTTIIHYIKSQISTDLNIKICKPHCE